MTNSTEPRASAHRRELEVDAPHDASDRDLPIQPVNEALDVAFLAIRSAQQAARDVPDDASRARFRDEWHTSNILIRQALRLVDERVQDLSRDLRRSSRFS